MSKIELSKEHYDVAVEELKIYFDCERDEQIGELQGKLILDFILEKIGPSIYNQAVIDMQGYLNEKVDDMYEFLR